MQDESLRILRTSIREGWSFAKFESELDKLFQDSPTSSAQIVEKRAVGANAIDWARLKTKYKDSWYGSNYQKLIHHIIAENQKKISQSVLRSDQDRLHDNLKNILPKEPDSKTFKIPDIDHALKRSSTLIKAADNSKLMSITRREEIRKVIKNILTENPVQTQTGAIRKDISRKVESGLLEYFEGYTKNSPPYGVPRNIHAIAVTETRSVINNTRREYMKMTSTELGDECVILKSWIHNGTLSKRARSNHINLAKFGFIELDQKFSVKGGDGKTYYVDGPHDYALPPSEVISCNCEIRYSIKRKKKTLNSLEPRDIKDHIFDTYKRLSPPVVKIGGVVFRKKT
ncbi:hypothetical protein [Leptospira mayottensis]|nr:hypothetical protein [Leptospira mayottensis]